MIFLNRMLIVLTSLLFLSCADHREVALSLQSFQKMKASDQVHWEVSDRMEGKASWYSIRTNFGTRTASGERLCNLASTAAHKTLPLGTQVRVTNLKNGKSEVVRINDRGPFIAGRIIDVTIGCAERLGFASRGIAPVSVEVLQPRESKAPAFVYSKH